MSALLVGLLLAAAPVQLPRDKLRLGVDYRWWGRNLQFTGAGAPAGLSLGPVPSGLTFDIQWYPASYFTSDQGADVGVTLRVDIAPELVFRQSDATVKATAMRLRTGMMFRLPFRYVEPSFHAGLHLFESTSELRSDQPLPPRNPNVSLAGPRLGLGLRLLEFWRITFDLAFGATWLLSTGELGSAAYFPGARGSAFDGSLGLAFRTWTFLDLRLGVDVTLHTLTLGRGVTATDAYYGISLGFVFKGVP